MSSNVFSPAEFTEDTQRSEGANTLQLNRLHKAHVIKTSTMTDQFINIYVIDRKRFRKHGAMLI